MPLSRMLALLLLAVACAGGEATPPPAAATTPPSSENFPERADEPSGWPIGFQVFPQPVDAKPGTPPRPDIRVWSPPGAKHLRAVFLLPNNSDTKHVGEHLPLRAMATRREMGIVYLSRGGHDEIQTILDAVAEKTGIVEYRFAPWVVFGKSSRGGFAHHLAWMHPKRVIAGINYHGAVPTFPPVPEAALAGETILWLNANGSTEWGGTWYNHVRPSLLNYHAQKAWAPHLIVARDVGHGDYADAHGSPGYGKPLQNKVSCLDTWNYISLYIDKAIGLRVPEGVYASSAPIELKQIDESQGWCIDPFAVEAMFDVPRLPLVSDGKGYVAAKELKEGEKPSEPQVSGFASIAPPKDFAVPAGVPVVAYESGKSPREWLITDSLKFAMADDPMVDIGPLHQLMPKPGDEVAIEGTKLSFQPIIPKYVGKNGGIALDTGLRPKIGKMYPNITLLAYTVLDITERRLVKVAQGFTAATRVQLVLSGVPVRHQQILELQPGRHPLLVLLRMSASWGAIEPNLVNAAEEEIALAKQMQAAYEQQLAEHARLKAEGRFKPELLIRKADSVPTEERKQMLWIADRELADAWLKYHSIVQRK